ncbi:MBL fold metallo-hydrolase [Thermodesulfobacteriota bacterium]
MKKLFFVQLFLCLCVFLVPLTVHGANYRSFYSPTFDENEARFIFLGASGIILNTQKGTILIDPAMMLDDNDIAQLKKGGLDLILFTHCHGDHYNTAIAEKLFKATGAPVLAESMVVESLSDKIPGEKLTAGLPGKTYAFGDIEIKVIEGDHIGPINLYQIMIGGITIFHGGDSAYVSLKDYPSDIAFVPTGAPSPTCSPEYAFKMASDLKPVVAVPMHGSHVEFEKIIKEKMPGITVIVPTRQVVTRVKLVR